MPPVDAREEAETFPGDPGLEVAQTQVDTSSADLHRGNPQRWVVVTGNLRFQLV